MKKMNLAQLMSIPVVILSLVIITLNLVSGTQLRSISKLSVLAEESNENEVLIYGKTVSHIQWVMGLRDAIDAGEIYTGESDPTQCSFGLWMYSDEVINSDNETVKALLEKIEPYHDDLHESMNTINAYIKKNDIDSAKDYYNEVTAPLLDNITGILDELEAEFESESSLASTALMVKQERTSLIILLTSIIGFVIGVSVSTLNLVSVVRKLRTDMKALSYSASMVSSASSQLTSAGQQLAEGANEQAASIEETSAVMEETASMVKQNAENTNHANSLSMKARVTAEEGAKKVLEMKSSMGELEKSSKDIAKIIKVIDDIAFQTNMLALNAAVEAARAGEEGLGFAVVAEEVRNLAQKSSMAAKDTEEIIEKNVALSAKGSEVSESVSTILEEIIAQTRNVNMLMDEITAASDEQAKGTAQVTDAIGQMEKVTQQNAATAEESAASAEELHKQSGMLLEISQRLNEMVRRSKSDVIVNAEDNAYVETKTHQVKSVSKAGKKIIDPDSIIPLDEDDGF